MASGRHKIPPRDWLTAANLITLLFVFDHSDVCKFYVFVFFFSPQDAFVIWCHCTKLSQLRVGVWLLLGLGNVWCFTLTAPEVILAVLYSHLHSSQCGGEGGGAESTGRGSCGKDPMP